MKKEFEKLHEQLTILPRYESSGSMSVANCPDDWNLCSVIIATWGPDNHRNFAHGMLTGKQVDRLIEALQEVRRDMPNG